MSVEDTFVFVFTKGCSTAWYILVPFLFTVFYARV